jgi:hypothetical protein
MAGCTGRGLATSTPAWVLEEINGGEEIGRRPWLWRSGAEVQELHGQLEEMQSDFGIDGGAKV